MNQKQLIKTGKFLALILRHQPEVIGLKLDSKGRVKITRLIQMMNKHGRPITRKELDTIVETNNKKRYVIDGDYIYAAQGHSIKDINIDMEEREPPDVLFHGTAYKNISSILKSGLNAANRNHVHLSIDRETAINVGSRHGKPVVLAIDAKMMYKDGLKFYISKNDVWLTNSISQRYLLDY